MRHHRDAAFGKELHRGRHHRAAFQLHRRRTGFLHHTRRRAEGGLRAFFIGTERQIDHHHAAIGTTNHCGAVRDHHVQRYLHRGVEAIDHLPQRIADQQQIAMRIEQLRHARGVSGEHHDRLTALALLDGRHCKAAHGLRHRVGAACCGVQREGGAHGRAFTPPAPAHQPDCLAADRTIRSPWQRTG